jgi:hypothetical protein
LNAAQGDALVSSPTFCFISKKSNLNTGTPDMRIEIWARSARSYEVRVIDPL